MTPETPKRGRKRRGEVSQTASGKRTINVHVDPLIGQQFDELLAANFETTTIAGFFALTISNLYQSWVSAGRPRFASGQIALVVPKDDETTTHQDDL